MRGLIVAAITGTILLCIPASAVAELGKNVCGAGVDLCTAGCQAGSSGGATGQFSLASAVTVARFSGRINNVALSPGSYRLVALAGSVVKRAEFKIVR